MFSGKPSFLTLLEQEDGEFTTLRIVGGEVK
jgi:hypothetical protein